MKDYTKFSKEQTKIEVPEVRAEVTPAIVNVEVMEEPKPEPQVIGVVTECEKLNVRRGSLMASPVLCTVNRGAKLVIDEKESTNEFYRVCTADGVKGYCVKKFINIKK